MRAAEGNRHGGVEAWARNHPGTNDDTLTRAKCAAMMDHYAFHPNDTRTSHAGRSSCLPLPSGAACPCRLAPISRAAQGALCQGLRASASRAKRCLDMGESGLAGGRQDDPELSAARGWVQTGQRRRRRLALTPCTLHSLQGSAPTTGTPSHHRITLSRIRLPRLSLGGTAHQACEGVSPSGFWRTVPVRNGLPCVTACMVL